MKATTDVSLTGLGVMEKMTAEITLMRRKRTARCVIPLETSPARTDAVSHSGGCVTLMMTVEIILMRL